MENIKDLTEGKSAQWREIAEVIDKNFAEIASGSGTVVVDSQMSSTSVNPVQNKVIKKYVDERTNELNISALYPTQGIGGSNKYDLARAIAQVPSEYRTVVGLKITFINNETSMPETWKYNGGTFTTTSNWVQGDGSGGNLILEWNTDVATTRKQVLLQERKSLLQISYKNADGDVINEQYIGSKFTDTDWVKNENWQEIAMLEDIKTKVDKLAQSEWVNILNADNLYMQGGIEVKKSKYWKLVDGVYQILQDPGFNLSAVKIDISNLPTDSLIRYKFNDILSIEVVQCDADMVGIKKSSRNTDKTKYAATTKDRNAKWLIFNITYNNTSTIAIDINTKVAPYRSDAITEDFCKIWYPIDAQFITTRALANKTEKPSVSEGLQNAYTVIPNSPRRVVGVRTTNIEYHKGLDIAIATKIDEETWAIKEMIVDRSNFKLPSYNKNYYFDKVYYLRDNEELAVRGTQLSFIYNPTGEGTYGQEFINGSHQPVTAMPYREYFPYIPNIAFIEYANDGYYKMDNETSRFPNLIYRELTFYSDYNTGFSVNGDGTFKEENGKGLVIEKNMKKCRAIITTPAEYGMNNSKYPLVIVFHENGANAERISIQVGSSFNIAQYLVSLGYICCCTEISQEYAIEQGWYSGSGTYNDTNSMACQKMLQTTIDMVKNVLRQYNIDESRIYMTGLSYGGFQALSFAEIFPYKIKAVAVDSPVIDSRANWYGNVSIHKQVAEYFDFDGKDNIQNTADDVIELPKMDGSNFVERNSTGEYPLDYTKARDKYSPSWKEGLNVQNMTWKKFTPIPTKIINGKNDSVVNCEPGIAYIVALRKGGSVADITTWTNGGHIDGGGTMPYKYNTVTQPTGGGGSWSQANLLATHYEIANWFYKFGGIKPVVALKEGMKFEIGLSDSIELTENPLTVQAFVNFDDITDDRDKGVKWSLADNDAAIASIDVFGNLTLKGTGSITLTATSLVVTTMTVSKVITITGPSA